MTESTHPLRVAVLGAGIIGAKHAKVATLCPDTVVAAVVSNSEDSASRLAESVAAETGAATPLVFSDLEACLASGAVDVVAICTPSGMHAEQASRVLDSGCHAIVEKPIDVSLAAARLLRSRARAAAREGLVTSVISQKRFYPGALAVRRAIDGGRFGRLTSGVTTLNWWRSQEYYDGHGWRGTWAMDGGGAAMNQGIHVIDLMTWFLGTPIEVCGQAALLAHDRVEVEDVAVASIRFESGALAVLHTTTAAYPGLTWRVQVHGDRGSAVIEDERLAYFHASGEGVAVAGPSGIGGPDHGNQASAEVGEDLADPARGPMDNLIDGHLAQYEDIVEAIRSGRPPTVGVDDGIFALAVVRGIYLSQALRRPVLIEDVIEGRHDDVEPVVAEAPRAP